MFGQIDKMKAAPDQMPLFIQVMPIAVNRLVVQEDRNGGVESPEAQRGQGKDVNVQVLLVDKRIADLDIFGNLVFRDTDVVQSGVAVSDRPTLVEMQLVVIQPTLGQVRKEHEKERQENKRNGCEKNPPRPPHHFPQSCRSQRSQSWNCVAKSFFSSSPKVSSLNKRQPSPQSGKKTSPATSASTRVT